MKAAGSSKDLFLANSRRPSAACRSRFAGEPRGSVSTSLAHDAHPSSLPPVGAIAIGHQLGASGARIMTALVNALEQRGARYGLQTMCEGGGMANATIIERLS